MEISQDLLIQAIELIKCGKTGKGGKILANLLIEQPNNAYAWLWMHFCVTSREKEIYCLERALKINPNLERA